MREILFRGKRTSDGVWVCGNLFIPDNKDTPTQICIGTHIIRITYDVIPETVGQYTGLIDKNDKKIFEGDIIHIVNRYGESTSIAVFSDHKFELDIRHYNEFAMEQGLSMRDSELGWTVIGNIHDNPEILEDKQ